MIEVDYNSNLEENIVKANKSLDRKGVFKKTAPIAITLLAGAYALFGFEVIDPTFINMLYAVGGIGAVYAANGIVTNAVMNSKIKKENRMAENSLNSLTNLLENEARVAVDIVDLKEAISEEKDYQKVTTETKKSSIEKISNEEKITKYFYLLDKDDQIKVLKQIATIRNDNVSDVNITGTGYETFLLENQDLKDEDLANNFRRILVRK